MLYRSLLSYSISKYSYSEEFFDSIRLDGIDVLPMTLRRSENCPLEFFMGLVSEQWIKEFILETNVKFDVENNQRI